MSNEELPKDAVAINNEQELKDFLSGEALNGYLTSDILFDWDEVGASVDFAGNRTLDGRGHSVTLSDKEAIAEVMDDDFDAINLNWQGIANDSKYGLFVRINEGVIKNIIFVFDSEVCAVNNGEVERNYVGIVCGENKGIIEKCDLNVSNKFAYFYISGEEEDSVNFQTHFGGFAGINSGYIGKVCVSYNDFFLRIRTKARSDNMFSFDEIIAKTFAGGVVGSICDGAECSNIVILGSDVTFSLTSDNVGSSIGCKYSGAVAAENSLGGKIDNVIVDFAPDYLEEDLSISKNAVVYCGQATNVTALDIRRGEVDLRCSNCDCQEHIKNYCNVIQVDDFLNFNVYIDDEGKQVVEITPIEYFIKSFSFNKYQVENMYNGSAEIIDDDTVYENVPDNIKVQDFQDNWREGIRLEIEPYQNLGECFWKIEASTWQKAQIEFSEDDYISYTGENMLPSFVRLKLENGSYCNYDLTKMDLTNNGAKIYEATFPGEYHLSLLPIEIDGKKYLYYDEENRIFVPVSDDVTDIHNYIITYARIVTFENTNDWINEDIVFTLENGIAGAADGLVYLVDGYSYAVDSLVLPNRKDSLDSEYTVFLTKDGRRVTDYYVFMAKIDVTAPTIENVEFLNPIDGNYYTQNYASFTISDMTSGIKEVKINSTELTETEGKYFVYLTRTGFYSVEAEDFAGNITRYGFYAYIDDVSPTLNVIATNDNGEYHSGNISPSDVRFEVSASFGESGGIIEYKIGSEDWSIYRDTITISTDVEVEFRARSNTSDGSGFLISETVKYHVFLSSIEKRLIITGDWFEVEGSKVYDGTDNIGDIRIQFDNTSQGVIDNSLLIKYLEFEAHFVDVNAGDRKEIVIDVWAMENTNIRIVNLISDVFGIIKRKQVRVTLNYAESTYGDRSPTYHYVADGVIDEICLDFVSNAKPDSLPSENAYRFWLEKSEFGNYTVENFDELNSFEKGAELIVYKAVISQLANNEEDFIGLDTNSVSNLKIKFRDVVDSDILYLLDTSFLNCDNGACLPTDSPSVAGEYKIRLFMPESLKSRYVLDESLFEIKVSIKDADADNLPDDDVENNDSSNDTDDGSNIEDGAGDKDVDGDNSPTDKIEDDNDESKINYYGKILITIGVASVLLCSVGILKRTALKKKNKKSK
ncbi:MAG: hypothetical protein K2J89_04060 [Clostridia bacterium]|nr:hypothetical protein [Clostridia bacterium]